MGVGLDHPQVAGFLARLEAAAAGLPAGRREELVAEIREHLADALAATAGDEVAVRTALDRLGDPDEIVAAESAGMAPGSGPGPGGWPGTAAPPGAIGDPTAAYPAAAYPASGWGPPPRQSPWGGLELAAVLLLTIGMFLLPIVGPLAGLAFAWASTRWTRREKVIATVLTVLPVIVLTLGALTLFVRSDSTSVVDSGVPLPIVESATATPLPTGTP